jgi:hypothetical protein
VFNKMNCHKANMPTDPLPGQHMDLMEDVLILAWASSPAFPNQLLNVSMDGFSFYLSGSKPKFWWGFLFCFVFHNYLEEL